MEIPVKNLYWMLCYAGDLLPSGKAIESAIEGQTDLLNLYARVLTEATERIHKAGLERNYKSVSDEGRTIRGKVDFTKTVGRMLLQQGKVAVDYDEYTSSIIPNQILKASVQLLSQNKNIYTTNQLALSRAARRLSDIEGINLTEREFKLLPRTYGNRLYPFAMMICQMIWLSAVPTETAGEYRFIEFYRDEKIMRKVFENFVRNFFRIEQTQYSVKSERFDWQVVMTTDSKDLLPQMETDTSLISSTRKIVIETKFVDGPVKAGRSEKETFRSGHLYQLNAYLSNLERRDGRASDGILLCPANVSSTWQRLSTPPRGPLISASLMCTRITRLSSLATANFSRFSV